MTGPTIPMTVFFITCGLTLFYLLKTRHLERMARIEHGMDNSHLASNNSLLLNLGLFLSFLGTGLLSAFGCARFFNTPEYVFVPGFMLLFGGIGLLTSYLLQQRKSK